MNLCSLSSKCFLSFSRFSTKTVNLVSFWPIFKVFGLTFSLSKVSQKILLEIRGFKFPQMSICYNWMIVKHKLKISTMKNTIRIHFKGLKLVKSRFQGFSRFFLRKIIDSQGFQGHQVSFQGFQGFWGFLRFSRHEYQEWIETLNKGGVLLTFARAWWVLNNILVVIRACSVYRSLVLNALDQKVSTKK